MTDICKLFIFKLHSNNASGFRKFYEKESATDYNKFPVRDTT